MANVPASVPKVFLSATWADLKEHREAAMKAMIAAGALPVTMEHFGAEPYPPVETCMRRVDECDAVVVVVAHRYGWAPEGHGGQSITRLECERALAGSKPKPIFAFLVDPDYAWPPEKFEMGRMLEVRSADPARQAKLFAEITEANTRLAEFKAWLGKHYTRAKFTTPDSLHAGVLQAISQWNRTPAYDTTRYLNWLREETHWINLKGLRVGSGEAARFEIEKLYVPLTAVDHREGAGKRRSGKGESEAPAEPRRVPLQEILREKKLVIQGDAGSGKTTFLRRLAREACTPGDWKVDGLPLLVRISELEKYIRANAVSSTEVPLCWIPRHLAQKGRDSGGAWDLDEAFFTDKLASGQALLLLDGLDEASNEEWRAKMAGLFETATSHWKDTRIIVTTRPAAYRGGATLAGFTVAKIDELDDDQVAKFLGLWSSCLYPENETAAQAHRDGLRRALDAKPEIRRMARNPVMLTALAVLYWHDGRLPEQRAELYESILGWLSIQRAGQERASGDECLRLFGHLALAMQENTGGMTLEVGRDKAAEWIAPQFRTAATDEKLERARRFLAAEEVDSGIITTSGSQVRFWHRTFQEYLAARTIAGLPDPFSKLPGERLYLSEWREVMLLLGGVLERGGRERLDELFRQLTEDPAKARLPEQARCFGLVGAMLRDLGPVGYALTGKAAEQYGEMSRAVRSLFEPGGAKGIPLEVRVEAAEELGRARDPRLRLPGDDDYWVAVPGGKFVMGAQKEDPKDTKTYDPDAFDWESVCPAEVKAFRIGKYPVTVWEYEKFVAAGGPKPDQWEDQQQHPSRPVVYVDWKAASDYAKWAGAALPDEEQWEFAARRGTGRRYAWGDADPDKELCNINRWVGAPSPVGLFPKGNTPDGISDITGNVWEWTASKHEKYGGIVVRGGAWYSNPQRARCAYRYFGNPENRNNNLGFRLVRQD